MYFEEIEKGYKFAGTSLTVTEAHITLFGSLSGDFHPLHMNEEFARKTQFGRRIAHGMLTASLAVPSILPLTRHAYSHLGEYFTFREPVLIGDTITTECEVVAAEPKAKWGLVRIRLTTRNQRGGLVLEGESVLAIRYKSKPTSS